MELVYLWVEDYKNIHKQGFNFSPRFRCEYDEEKNELEIIDKDETGEFYPKNFFGDNINVTAIVGENGSGKSSIIEILFKILFQNEFRKNKNEVILKDYILIFKTSIGNQFYTDNEQLKKKLISDDYAFTERKELSPGYYLLMDFSLGQNSIYNSKKNYKENYSLEPSRISMTDSSGEFLGKIESNAFNNNMKMNAIFFYFFIKKNKLEKILEELSLPNLDILNFLKPSSYSHKNKIEKFDEFKKEEIIFSIYNFKKIKSYKDLTNALKKDFKDITIDKLSINDIIEFEKMFYFMSIQIKNNSISFENLSTGQKLLISYFGIIVRSILFRKNKTSFSIIFDEVENSLHPRWQKRIIKYLVIFLNSISESKLSEKISNYKLVFLTHSPFILSDLTKENIIFLDKYNKNDNEVKDGLQKEGNCNNISNSIDIKQTFGANIHTLLSHGFFMKDGLMGEFAKEKINQVYDFIVQRNTNFIKTKEEAQNIINIIGEPLIKKQLQKLFDDTFEKNNFSLDVEIELLEKKLNALKELKK
jgi:predicted ATP-binding protein involved in virulence